MTSHDPVHLPFTQAPDVTPTSGLPGGSKPGIWKMYLNRAFKLDHASVESWREDMDSLLLFVSMNTAHPVL
jgi:hypothetical protein